MVEENTADLSRGAEGAAEADQVKRERERSRIEFPYTDLESAVDLVRALQRHGGTVCEPDQLAGWMDQSPTGGTFRSRLSASRLFGLVETQQGQVSLTPLGQEIVDDAKGRAARVEAFLRAPLYRAMYEKYKGFPLPPPPAVERQMVGLGVPEKQKERARQTFTKSAIYAGFIDQQSGRVVKPGNGGGAQPAADKAPVKVAERGGGGGGSGDGEPPLHLLIQGLLKTLPPPSSEWSVAEQAKWLQTAASIFGLIYKSDGTVKVEPIGGSGARGA